MPRRFIAPYPSFQGPAAPKTYKFTAAELAVPSEHHQNPAKLVPRPDGASLTLPPGFTATLFASGGFKRPRNVAQAPNGDIFLSNGYASNHIFKYDKSGKYLMHFGEKGNGL